MSEISALIVCVCKCSPLGPFVPAPPEVAMRMLREQGGPSPFEGPGRNGMGAPPIILPPSFRQDPRRLRRYLYLKMLLSFFRLKYGFLSCNYFLANSCPEKVRPWCLWDASFGG